MHELTAEYKENDCSVIIEDVEPYVILNLEKYVNGSSHCDFVYVSVKDDECEIFLVELKGVRSDELDKPLRNIQNKFPQTLSLIKTELSNALKIPNRSKYYGVVILPGDKISLVQHLLTRGRIQIGGLSDLDQAWVAPCGGYIREMWLVLK